MTKTTKICDNCDKNLIVDSQYPVHYTLELNVVNTGINTSQSTYCIAMYPPFEGTKHFCNTKCLAKWLEVNSLKKK